MMIIGMVIIGMSGIGTLIGNGDISVWVIDLKTEVMIRCQKARDMSNGRGGAGCEVMIGGPSGWI